MPLQGPEARYSQIVKSQLQRDKSRNSQSVITYRRITIRLTADFSTETLQARREWDDILRVLIGKKQKDPAKITIASKAILRNERKTEKLQGKQKLWEFITMTQLALQ